MNDDRSVAAAAALMRLGVSRAGIVDLLAHHPIETIERQLRWLPLRKARRPEALVIDAIRFDYSSPNLFRHAKDEAPPPGRSDPVHEGAKPRDRRPHAGTEGH